MSIISLDIAALGKVDKVELIGLIPIVVSRSIDRPTSIGMLSRTIWSFRVAYISRGHEHVWRARCGRSRTGEVVMINIIALEDEPLGHMTCQSTPRGQRGTGLQ